MDFALSDDQQALRENVRAFARAEIAPHVADWDESETFPLDLIRTLGQLGYMGCTFPEDLGGAGLDYVSYCLVVEELARVDPIGGAHRGRAYVSVREPSLSFRERRTTAPLPAQARGRRVDRLLGAHRVLVRV